MGIEDFLLKIRANFRFKKYVSMSVLAHNIHQIGALVQRKIQKQNNHKDPDAKIAA